jgi:hypothetical protein
VTDIDVITHRAGPKADEPPYFRECLGCRQAWPCPSRRADIVAEQTEIIRAVRAQVSDDARRVGVLALVELGVSCWSSTRVDAFDQPLGGVVVHIEDDVDRETGEVSRWFTCLSLGYGPKVEVRRIAEAEVLQTGVQATDGSTITKLVKKLAGEVHDAKGSYLDLRCSERIRWQYVLAGVANLAA